MQDERHSEPAALSGVIEKIRNGLAADPMTADTNAENLPLCECQNHGWLLVNYPDGRQIKQTCPLCEQGQRVLERLLDKSYRDARLPAMYRDFTFETWAALPVEQRKGKHLAEAAAQEFCHQLKGNVSSHGMIHRLAARFPSALDKFRDALEKPEILYRGFILAGLPGTGKTGLCAATINRMITLGGTVMYLRVLDALKALSSTWQDGGERELLDAFKTAPVLFLDDFGLDSPPRDHQREYMQIIIRYRAANRLATMVTTNLTRDDFIAQWGNQTADVLLELCAWITVSGAKLRNTSHTWEAF